jgi:prephenate dehydratase
MESKDSTRDSELNLWYGAKEQSREAQPDFPVNKTRSGVAPVGMKIAIQGEPGSFSHEAAVKMVAGAAIVPHSLSAEVFRSLSQGTVEAAVIPIENSLAGPVSEHYDLLLAHDVKVERETELRIRHNLIAISGTSIGEIDRVFSHPIALAQCKQYLARHPKMEAYAFYDTAGSVKQLVALRDRHAAAIASRAAAEYYGAQILEADIEDNPENFTRFFLVRRAENAEVDPASNKISLAFSLENKPGSLVSALTELAALGTNLTKIESRPVHGKPWEYIFYVDCQIKSLAEAESAVAALHHHCVMVKELGRYREAQK